MRRERFLALDAIRGVAALGVLSLHYSTGSFPQRGYLAVDIFFVLSGFVIAHAYEGRLLNGLSFQKFAMVRAIRLYPLVWLGILLTVGVTVLLRLIGRDAPFDSLWPLLCGAAILPYISRETLDMYPVNSPTWSLFNELVINLLYAAVVRWLSNRILIFACLASCLVLFPATVIHGNVNFGPFRGTLVMGLVRTLFSFSCGVLIYRLKAPRLWACGFPTIALLSFGIIALMAVTAWGGVYDALAVTVAVPALIAVAAHIRLFGKVAEGAAWLGDLSYPVYILHWPIRSLLFATGLQTHVPQGVFMAVGATVVCVASYAALNLYDAPVRKWLAGNRRAAAHPVTAP